MFLNIIFISLKRIYIIFFLTLLFIIITISKVHPSIFKVSDIEVTEPFDPNFKKKKVIDKAIILAFKKLLNMTVSTYEMHKISSFSAQEIKNLIDSFTIKDEKFVNNNYNAKFEVNFNKQNTFLFIEKKNIYPSIPNKKKILILPILIDSQSQNVNIFNQNPFYKYWNINKGDYNLIDYILLSEDIDLVKILNDNLINLESYDFSQVVENYDFKEYIVCLIYKEEKGFKIYSKIKFSNKFKITSKVFPKKDINSQIELNSLIDDIKLIYEDEWKKINQINRSVKLPINLSISSLEYKKNEKFVNFLSSTDLVSNYSIKSFNNKDVNYKIIFNGSPKEFLSITKKNNFLIDTNKQIWEIK